MEVDQRAEIGMTSSDRRIILVGFPLAGAAVAALLPIAWRWLEDLEWLPWRPVWELVMGFEESWQVALRIALLSLAGLLLALYAIHDETTLAVGPDDVIVTKSGTTRVIRRDQVVGAHLDGKKLVIAGAEGRTLLEAQVDNAKSLAAPAFRRFGYPWEGAD